MAGQSEVLAGPLSQIRCRQSSNRMQTRNVITYPNIPRGRREILASAVAIAHIVGTRGSGLSFCATDDGFIFPRLDRGSPNHRFALTAACICASLQMHILEDFQRGATVENSNCLWPGARSCPSPQWQRRKSVLGRDSSANAAIRYNDTSPPSTNAALLCAKRLRPVSSALAIRGLAE